MHYCRLNKSDKGSLALEYGEIIEELWSGKKRNIAPIKLRVRKYFFYYFYL